ncbi:MAG: cell division protein FtsZ, partial [Anaerolineales bacterium]|nr:cell division protein FtsZ [Anaerolineales bacterium]
INLDFADVQTIMSMGGAALMAVGKGKGDNRAMDAAQAALSSHLLDVTIDGAKGILFNVTGGKDLSLYEINQAAALIRETAHPDVNLIFGAVVDETMGDEIRITVIATGFEHSLPMMRQMTRPQARQVASRPPVRESASVSSTSTRPTTPPVRRETPEPPAYRVNDLDIPAFLRKKRGE